MARSRKVKQTWVLFIVTFLVSLIVITYFIKSMSPDVDVEIGGDDTQSTSVEESSESDVKKAIDDRLRWIQMEDNMPGVSKREDGTTAEDVMYESSDQDKSQKSNENSDKQNHENKQSSSELAPVEYVNPQQHQPVLQPPVPVQPNAQPAAEPFKMSKVYVGSYPTIEQAIQAQNKLMNTSISVSPFVKEVNGTYVLQAGSYANAGKAEAVSREINSLGFHARVVKE